ncbi:lysine exporter protein (LYSE/YGGA) [Nonlabens sp. MIC269]|uniref:LysE family transporter n=1 Tax=Nonlabens TaxID=363408 RepID=UPI0007225358|nr:MULTISPECIES: LysE family transporter [Nonlabens]ALM20810.1 lysine exporter protein (LYSE/YGGA) [Nonlabens sp. MIC269]ARN72472.1 lysine transporter LysE [Nonlabens tegetincola]MEE2800666.1 LysE family transporter [Bacteroidota bacterium]PQJ18997.1 lysine transporter LysE [Nonlabens tegetincola]
MDSFWHFVFGFSVGFIGVIPPGLLNLTAAKISVNQGRRAAVLFCVGASLVVVAQVYVGVFFSKLLTDNQQVLIALERFAIIAFFALSIFFFIKARLDTATEVKAVEKSGYKLLGHGIILSTLNVFPIPFYIGFSSFLADRDLFKFESPTAHFFIFGACLGTFLMLLAYVKYVKKFGFDSVNFARNINYLLSGLTFLIALVSLIKMRDDIF